MKLGTILTGGVTEMAQWLVAGASGSSRLRLRAAQVAVDTVLLASSYAAALLLRFESLTMALSGGMWLAFALSLPITIFVFARVGFYRAIILYIGAQAFQTILIAGTAAGVSLFLVSVALGLGVPLSVPILYSVLATGALGFVRFLIRGAYRRVQTGNRQKVAIFGAGPAGRELVRFIKSAHRFRPICFIDDSPALEREVIHGLTVFRSSHLARLTAVPGGCTVLIAVPDEERQAAVDLVAAHALSARVIGGAADLVSPLSGIDTATFEALSGLPPMTDPAARVLAGQTVAVLGAAGRQGRAICRAALRQGCARLVAIDRHPEQLRIVAEECRHLAQRGGMTAEIVDIADPILAADTLDQAFARHRPRVVIQATPQDAVFGRTLADLAGAAGRAGAECLAVVLANPYRSAVEDIAHLGAAWATLRAEHPRLRALAIQPAMATSTPDDILGVFARSILAGGPVQIADPRMSRRFLLDCQFADLALLALGRGRGGETLVILPGPPVSIADLVTRLIRHCGYAARTEDVGATGEGTVHVRFTGLRPGEDLHDTVVLPEAHAETDHPMIVRAMAPGHADARRKQRAGVSQAGQSPHVVQLDGRQLPGQAARPAGADETRVRDHGNALGEAKHDARFSVKK